MLVKKLLANFFCFKDVTQNKILISIGRIYNTDKTQWQELLRINISLSYYTNKTKRL